MGLTIAERDQIGRNDPTKAQEHDLKFEDYQKSLSLDDNIILDGRMAFWCQPQAFKIFLDVSDQE
jgi:cytidylate kinase